MRRPRPSPMLVLLLTLLLGPVAAACSGAPAAAPAPAGTSSTAVSAPTTAPPSTTSSPSTVYANDPAKVTAAKVGQVVALRVDTNPSVDDAWQVVRYDQDKLFDVGASYDDPAKAVPGRAVTQNLLFRAIAPGTATVVLRYGKPDAPDPTDATVTFTIAVA